MDKHCTMGHHKCCVFILHLLYLAQYLAVLFKSCGPSALYTLLAKSKMTHYWYGHSMCQWGILLDPTLTYLIFSYQIFVRLICEGDPCRPPCAAQSFCQNKTVSPQSNVLLLDPSLRFNIYWMLDNCVIIIFVRLICEGGPHRPPFTVWSFDQNEMLRSNVLHTESFILFYSCSHKPLLELGGRGGSISTKLHTSTCIAIKLF